MEYYALFLLIGCFSLKLCEVVFQFQIASGQFAEESLVSLNNCKIKIYKIKKTHLLKKLNKIIRKRY